MHKSIMLLVALLSCSLFSQHTANIHAQSAQPMDCIMGNIQQLRRGEAQSGAILMIDQIASYWFIAHAGLTLQVDLDVSADFDGVVSLYKSPEGYLVRQNMQARGDSEIISYRIESTDKYCIIVSGYQGAIGEFDIMFTYVETAETPSLPDLLSNTDIAQESSFAQLTGTVPEQCLYPRELITGVYPAMVNSYDIYYAQVYLDINQADRDELTVTVVPLDFDAVLRVYSPIMMVQFSDTRTHHGLEMVQTRANVTGYYCITVYAHKRDYSGRFEMHIETH